MIAPEDPRRWVFWALELFLIEVPEKAERARVITEDVDRIKAALDDVPGHRVLIALYFLLQLLVQRAAELEQAEHGGQNLEAV